MAPLLIAAPGAREAIGDKDWDKDCDKDWEEVTNAKADGTARL